MARADGREEDCACCRPWCLHPECSQKHLSGFMEKAAELRAKGVDTVACVSVNDAFVMKAWKERLGLSNDVLLLSDGNIEPICDSTSRWTSLTSPWAQRVVPLLRAARRRRPCSVATPSTPRGAELMETNMFIVVV